MEIEGVGVGKFSAVVWPTWIGAALAYGMTPPFSVEEPRNNGYQRGAITWLPDETGEIVGRARIVLPVGVYSHFVFAHSPSSAKVCGTSQMDHTMRCAEVTVLDVFPIRNSDLVLSQGGNTR